MKDVYAIYESKSDGHERSRWVRVGVAFDNRDGSLNVLLDALPLSGRLQIRTRSNDRPAEISDAVAADPVASSGSAARTIRDDSAMT
ncbi:MAG: hypothetical protein ABW298_02350 [Candidatus Binatia bacterium]